MRDDGILLKTEMPELGEPKRGKVRDIYDFPEHLMLVTTDRLSAFDVVLPNGIPLKGRILNQLSLFWFRKTSSIIQNHIISADPFVYDSILNMDGVCEKYANQLEGRSVLVKKAKALPVEAIPRGYLSGSGWKSYKKDRVICGIRLRDGYVESDKLDEAIFTSSTKAEEGHDINIGFDEMVTILSNYFAKKFGDSGSGNHSGKSIAEMIKRVSLAIYKDCTEYAHKRGIIIADTKFEFGLTEENELILIDEILTPDSSRFWSVKNYQSGRGQDSFDKQIVRDYLETLDWDKKDPGPVLPDHIVEKTAIRYRQIYDILTA